MVVQVAVAIVERNGAEQKSKQGVVGIATKKEGDGRKKRLWLVVVVIFGGRFRCNQSFAGATELGQEMKYVKRASVANGIAGGEESE
jgi:hypothetical protein